MANKSINQFTSGSIHDDSLLVIGDPNTGTLTQTGYKSAKDYFQQGISSSAPVDSGSFALTSSLNSFTASYITDSASFDARINAILVRLDNKLSIQ